MRLQRPGGKSDLFLNRSGKVFACLMGETAGRATLRGIKPDAAGSSSATYMYRYLR